MTLRVSRFLCGFPFYLLFEKVACFHDYRPIHTPRGSLVAWPCGGGVVDGPCNPRVRASVFPALLSWAKFMGHTCLHIMCFNKHCLVEDVLFFWTISFYVTYWPPGNLHPELSLHLDAPKLSHIMGISGRVTQRHPMVGVSKQNSALCSFHCYF